MINFAQDFPVVVEQLTNTEQLNPILEKNIKESGDAFEGRNSSAKCLMTRWDMHKVYESFAMIGDAAIRLANLIPMAARTKMDGTPNPITLEIDESWGLIYNKDQSTGTHMHWPALWSYTYCVKACSKCSPFTFTDISVLSPNKSIKPKEGQMILFPAWIFHEVPKQECEHERIMIAGNLREKYNE